MNKTSKIAIISIVGVALMSSVPFVFAQTTDFVPSLGPTTVTPTVTTTNTSEASSAIVPTNTGSNSSESVNTPVPTTVGSNNTGNPSIVPTNSGSNSSESGTTLVPTTVGSNSNEISSTVTPTTPVTPSGGGGGSTGSVSLYGGSSSSGSIVPIMVIATSTPTTTPFTSCPLINSFMKFGANNNSSDVIKLQAFLKNNQNLDVNLSGIFDSKTEAAVKDFQKKYLTDIMGPWQATAPSGIVYITTEKKINEIACNSSLKLSADEMSIINSYIQNQNSSTSSTTGAIIGTTGGSVGPNVPTTTPTIGDNTNGNGNTASVINASIFQRIWNFIKNLF